MKEPDVSESDKQIQYRVLSLWTSGMRRGNSREVQVFCEGFASWDQLMNVLI